LWRWSRSHKAPAPVKVGGTVVRYRRSEYLAWIQAGCPNCRNWSWTPNGD
jgi:predicted DNA-binding transcriptional regulator AlpA